VFSSKRAIKGIKGSKRRGFIRDYLQHSVGFWYLSDQVGKREADGNSDGADDCKL